MNNAARLALAAFLLLGFLPSVRADELEDLAREFWAWRSVEQPVTGDDIPRIERPQGWVPNWSQTTLAERRQALAAFEDRWRRIEPSGWPINRQIDYRLIGSALARVRWELEVTRGWQRNPMFYIDQTLGVIFVSLLEPPPFSRPRSEEIVKRMASIPRTVENAKTNPVQPQKPFAHLAIERLKDVRSRLSKVARELRPTIEPELAAELDATTEKAIAALESYHEWLDRQLPSLGTSTAVGRDAYEFFLKNVALMPFTPEQLLAIGRQEWARAVAFETLEARRNHGLPQLALFPNQAAQMAREQHDELEVRRFLEDRGILSVPAWVKHYRNLPLPAYLEPLSDLGVTDDLTSPGRLKDDGTSYIRPPSPALGYFALASARDPRPLVVHEGFPGHYFQLVLSWAHEDPIRRHYYDSGANEGIAYYAEEMMLQAGLFDQSPRTREIIYNMMRLRALRVEVDVKLALGVFSIDQAAEYLAKTVPMDRETARAEAAFFAASPGQAISYQIGKMQIVNFLADARRAQGDRFSLKMFHDFLLKNGNVPIALERWEYLGLRDEIELIDKRR